MATLTALQQAFIEHGAAQWRDLHARNVARGPRLATGSTRLDADAVREASPESVPLHGLHEIIDAVLSCTK